MKILKKIGIALLALIGVILIAGLLMKKEFKVTRTVELDQPVNEVYDYVKYLKNQQEYSAWAKMDPNQKISEKGTDGTVGYVSMWDSKKENVGKGEQEIMKMVENERIDYEMRFVKPEPAEGKASMIFKSSGEDCTNLEWFFEGEMPYPFNVMMPFIDFEEALGPQLQEGLDNLKVILDKK